MRQQWDSSTLKRAISKFEIFHVFFTQTIDITFLQKPFQNVFVFRSCLVRVLGWGHGAQRNFHREKRCQLLVRVRDFHILGYVLEYGTFPGSTAAPDHMSEF